MSVRFANALTAEDKQKRKAEGTLCALRRNGYKGRVGTYELMKMNRAIEKQSNKERQLTKLNRLLKKVEC